MPGRIGKKVQWKFGFRGCACEVPFEVESTERKLANGAGNIRAASYTWDADLFAKSRVFIRSPNRTGIKEKYW
jgi:hypothetical protein